MQADQSSLFRRLMLGFGAVIFVVAVVGMIYVVLEARASQRSRTAAENAAHARELLMHLSEVARDPARVPERVRRTAEEIEQVRVEMFHQLDYHSQVRTRVWLRGELLYNSRPELPEKLPLSTDSVEARTTNAWVQAIDKDEANGLVVERTHEVDDRWMLTISGVTFLLRSTIFSLPLLLLPAWLIIRIGLKPLRSIAAVIENRSDQDLTPLPASPYRELTPLVTAINHLMARLRRRIEHEHEFLSDAAHELKTPLAAIQINAHLLQTMGLDAALERKAEVAAGLRQGVTRANHLAHQLLALERARAEPGAEALPALSLETLVRDRLAAAAPLGLQRGIEIDFHADGDEPRPLHQESLWALVDNLIGNAIKYSPEGGSITVQLTRQPDGGYILSVTDQGPGIPEAMRQRVFERFYRIPGQEQTGSGLGLAIAERAAVRNGASIRLADGVDGKGLTVLVEFAPVVG